MLRFFERKKSGKRSFANGMASLKLSPFDLDRKMKA